jgi:hypothetical protein
MTNKIKLIICCLLAGLCWLAPVQAQDADNEGIARVVLITPKEGHEQVLVKAITDYHHWIANFDGHHEYQWYEIVTGPHTGSYIARTGNHDWADFDAEHEWLEQADETFTKNVAPHIQDADIRMTQEMREFGHWPESFDGYTHFIVEDWYIQNGRYSKFREGLKKIVDTLKAANFDSYWGFFSVVSGGHGNQVQFVSANRGWSDMTETKPSFVDIMSKELGGPEAFESFMSDWSATFKTGDNQMVRLMPEASDYGK